MSVVDDVRARLDIVETVGGYVALQRSGRSFKALCPFHTEKTPSFIVNPERQSWRCFGACATGGDAFNFVMRTENLDFGAALRMLAQRVGVQLSETRDGDRNEPLYRVNQEAARYFHEALLSPKGKRARDYLESRGVNEQARSRFQLGLSPGGRDSLKSHLLTLGFDEGQAVEAGLLHRNEAGATYDFFRDRLIFPIQDRQGRVVGFGARALDGANPKYLNTSKTPVFDKRATLYGLHLAEASIRGQKSAVIVEGYMDAIAAHQYGYENVVASMGTALTEQQVSQMRSLATDFVLALDPDAAGQEATLRSLESSWRVFERHALDRRTRSVGVLYQREPLMLRIAALPEGRDPDIVIREEPAEWERLTREAQPLMDYLIPALATRFDLSTGQGKAQAVESLFPLISSVQNPFDQERYVQRLAQVLGVTEEALKASVGRLGVSTSRGGRSRPSTQSDVSVTPLSGAAEDSVGEYTLALLLRKPELRELALDFSPDNFHKAEDREVFTRWKASSTIDDLRGALDEPLQAHLAYLHELELAPADASESRQAVGQCLQRLERRHLQELQEGLLASDEVSLPPPREIEGTITEVNARLKQLFSERKG